MTISNSIKQGRLLGLAAFLVNLTLMVLIGMTFGENPFQMLFGFSPQVRNLFILTAALMGMFGLTMAFKAVQWWRHEDGGNSERVMLMTVTMVTLVYAASMGLLGS